jgi:hypothetical protein
MSTDGPMPAAESIGGITPHVSRTIVGAEGVAKISESFAPAITVNGGDAMLTPSESSSG